MQFRLLYNDNRILRDIKKFSDYRQNLRYAKSDIRKIH